AFLGLSVGGSSSPKPSPSRTQGGQVRSRGGSGCCRKLAAGIKPVPSPCGTGSARRGISTGIALAHPGTREGTKMKGWLMTLAGIGVCAAPLCAADMPVPQDRGALRCQKATLRLAARLMGCVTDCYGRAASHAFHAEAFDLEACTGGCEGRFQASTERLPRGPAGGGPRARPGLAPLVMESGHRSGDRGYCMPPADESGGSAPNYGG